MNLGDYHATFKRNPKAKIFGYLAQRQWNIKFWT